MSCVGMGCVVHLVGSSAGARCHLDHLEDLLGLVQEEHLLGRVGHRPEGEDGLDDLLGVEAGVRG